MRYTMQNNNENLRKENCWIIIQFHKISHSKYVACFGLMYIIEIYYIKWVYTTRTQHFIRCMCFKYHHITTSAACITKLMAYKGARITFVIRHRHRAINIYHMKFCHTCTQYTYILLTYGYRQATHNILSQCYCV